MPQIVVQKATPIQTKTGKLMYKCIGTIDGEVDTFTAWDSPALNTPFEAFIKEDKFGKTLSTRNPETATSGRSYGKSDEERGEMRRENALTNATNRAVALANIYNLNGEKDNAVEALKPRNIAKSAWHFERWNNSKWFPFEEETLPKSDPEETFDTKPFATWLEDGA